MVTIRSPFRGYNTNALSLMAKMYHVIQIKLNQFKKMSITDLPTKRINDIIMTKISRSF